MNGSIFLLNDAVASFDLFENSQVFAKLLPKLVRSHALDALERKVTSNVKGDQIAGSSFMKAIAHANQNEFPAVGLGTDYRIADEMLSGGALVFEGRLIHVSAFPRGEDENSRGPGRRSQLVRSSQRRNLH
jgi:hypothetical protein